ncbi:MAG: SpoIIE family protein phosphatase [Acidobacteriota bacterium]
MSTQDYASLLADLGRRANGRSLARHLLTLWYQSVGATGAAFYRRSDDQLCRELTSGEGTFPAEAASSDEHLVLGDGVLVVAGDAQPRVNAEALALAAVMRADRLEQELKRQHFQANFRGVELEALYDVGLAIASTLDLEDLSDEVLLRAVSLLDARRGALFLAEGGSFQCRQTFGGEARQACPMDHAGLERLFAAAPGADDHLFADLLPGVSHLLAVPVGDRRGLLLLGDKESRRGIGPFPDEDRRTLSLFANQAAIALENARLHRQALEAERLGREMELAAEIQGQILPDRLPEVAGLEVAGWNRPARQVGGDYYDLVLTGEGRLGLALGDVTGKGMPASLLVSTLHSSLTLLRDRSDLGPRLVERLNHHVFESSASNKFITLIVAELDATSGNLVYVNAGHNPGLLVRADGAVEKLVAGGLPLGLLADSRYQARSIMLEAGDLLCLYSDGITECANPEDDELGEERLAEMLVERREVALGDIIADIDAETQEFAAGLPQGDDQTVVLVRRSG